MFNETEFSIQCFATDSGDGSSAELSGPNTLPDQTTTPRWIWNTKNPCFNYSFTLVSLHKNSVIVFTALQVSTYRSAKYIGTLMKRLLVSIVWDRDIHVTQFCTSGIF